MRVQDDTISKYNAMGKISRLGLKRPSTVVFKNHSKIQKLDANNQCNVTASNMKNNDKLNVNIHQWRKSLPVYILRKR